MFLHKHSARKVLSSPCYKLILIQIKMPVTLKFSPWPKHQWPQDWLNAGTQMAGSCLLCAGTGTETVGCELKNSTRSVFIFMTLEIPLIQNRLCIFNWRLLWTISMPEWFGNQYLCNGVTSHKLLIKPSQAGKRIFHVNQINTAHADDLDPVSLTFFPSQFKFDGNFVSLSPRL